MRVQGGAHGRRKADITRNALVPIGKCVWFAGRIAGADQDQTFNNGAPGVELGQKGIGIEHTAMLIERDRER